MVAINDYVKVRISNFSSKVIQKVKTFFPVETLNTFSSTYGQGCQMVCFQTKNPNLVKFLRALYWKMLICYVAIWNILRTFGIFYDQLVHFVFIWCIFPFFGIMRQEKSGNPAYGPWKALLSLTLNQLVKILENLNIQKSVCKKFFFKVFDFFQVWYDASNTATKSVRSSLQK
jgi:hypothetical protein